MGLGHERAVPDGGRRATAARGLAPAHLAEDVAQEAMLVAYRRWREVAELERPDLWVRLAPPTLTWSPDGSGVAIATTKGAARPGAVLVSPDGSEVSQLGYGSFSALAWQPVID